MAGSSIVAGGVARAISPSPSVASGKAAEAAETAGTTAGETAQTQGGPSCGQGQREEGCLQQRAEILSQVTEPIAASINASKLPWAQSFQPPL